MSTYQSTYAYQTEHYLCALLYASYSTISFFHSEMSHLLCWGQSSKIAEQMEQSGWEHDSLRLLDHW